MKAYRITTEEPGIWFTGIVQEVFGKPIWTLKKESDRPGGSILCESESSIKVDRPFLYNYRDRHLIPGVVVSEPVVKMIEVPIGYALSIINS
jgi:hypothetical protein